MGKTVHCKCKTGCRTGRCVCYKSNEPCDEKCGCTGCHNPFNGMDIDNLSICALQNIEEYKELSEEELEEQYQLPCGCEQVSLKRLMGDYSCSKCVEAYWYSLCWDEVVEDSCTWHCEICQACREIGGNGTVKNVTGAPMGSHFLAKVVAGESVNLLMIKKKLCRSHFFRDNFR